jgi:hypothetical protein
LSVLQPQLHERYVSAEPVLLSPPPSPELVESTGATFGISPSAYPKLIQLLVDIGMVELRKCAPTVINGVFAVPKDEQSQRLIIDARRANLFFCQPDHVDLPSPAMFVDFFVQPGFSLFVGKSDIRNMYHRFRVPEWMETFFGLPFVSSGDAGRGSTQTRLYPVVVSLPMGFSHAVLLAHSANQHVSVQKPFGTLPYWWVQDLIVMVQER